MQEAPIGFSLRCILRTQDSSLISWSPDGAMISSIGSDGRISIWDVDERRHLKSLRAQSGDVFYNVWSPDSRVLASGSPDGTIRLVAVETGQQIGILKGHTAFVRRVGWSPDGKLIATASEDDTVRLWGSAGGELRSILEGRPGGGYDLAWAPDSLSLAATASESWILVWKVVEKSPPTGLFGHAHSVYSLAWSPLGSYLVSGGSRTIKIWNPGVQRPLETLEDDSINRGPITYLEFSYDGNLLASQYSHGFAHIWHFETRRRIATLAGQPRGFDQPGPAFHPFQNALAAISDSEDVQVWDIDMEIIESKIEKAPDPPQSPPFKKAPSRKAPRDVFLSHVEQDQDVALAVAECLQSRGYSVWCYEKDSIPGKSYLTQTGDAIASCRAFMLLISPHSLSSHQIDKEVERAHEESKPFVPVRLEVSHLEFQNRRPLWRQAIGTIASIEMSRSSILDAMPRIIEGIESLGISPSVGKS